MEAAAKDTKDLQSASSTGTLTLQRPLDSIPPENLEDQAKQLSRCTEGHKIDRRQGIPELILLVITVEPHI